MEFLMRILDASDFPAKWNSGLWSAGHGWLHIVSDLSVFVAAVLIAGAVAFRFLKCSDPAIGCCGWLLSTFILVCGFVHLVEAALFWMPWYRLLGILKAIAAVTGLLSVFGLVLNFRRLLVSPTSRAAREVADSSGIEHRHHELESVTDQRKEELRAAHDRLDLALTGAEVGLWDWDAQTNEVYFSPSLKRQLGYPDDAEWNDFEDWRSRLHPNDVADAEQRVNDYLSGKLDEYVSTFRMECKDGSYRWMLSRGRATFDRDRKPIRVIGIHVDVTERMERQRELAQLHAESTAINAALQQSNEDLQQFAYVASHDLKEPLRAVSSFAELLAEKYKGELDEKAHQYIEFITDGAQRMRIMIDDLLRYSRVSTHGGGFQEVDVRSLVDAAIVNLSESIKESNATISIGSLPRIRCDRSQLTRVFQNLIGNAIKFCRGESPEVIVSAEEKDDVWRFSVQDNGIGLQPEFADRIFVIFQRLHNRSKYPGTGIGLSICQRIIRRHDGEIWVESEPEKGSTFFFTISKTLA